MVLMMSWRLVFTHINVHIETNRVTVHEFHFCPVWDEFQFFSFFTFFMITFTNISLSRWRIAPHLSISMFVFFVFTLFHSKIIKVSGIFICLLEVQRQCIQAYTQCVWPRYLSANITHCVTTVSVTALWVSQSPPHAPVTHVWTLWPGLSLMQCLPNGLHRPDIINSDTRCLHIDPITSSKLLW